MVEFSNTGFGHAFFNAQLPALIRALEKIGSRLPEVKTDTDRPAMEPAEPAQGPHECVSVRKNTEVIIKPEEGSMDYTRGHILDITREDASFYIRISLYGSNDILTLVVGD